MGEIADDHVDRMWRRQPSIRQPLHGFCDRCGVMCKWRLHGGGYRLFDLEKQHPGNRYVLHTCKTSADGFEDEPS